jgi:predicted metal-binding membrane protein
VNAPTSGDGAGRFAWLRPSTPLGQARLVLLGSLIVLTAATWAVTLHQAWSMAMPMGIAVRGGMAGEGMSGMAMAGMAAPGWSVGAAAMFLVMWTVMMAAMMLPAAAPMLLIFTAVQAKGRGRVAVVPTWIFAAGYLLVWAAVGLAVYILVQIGSDLATHLAPAGRAVWAPPALGATLVVAGLYQFTPLKRVCLSQCRSPLGFVMQHWRGGRLGALRMGIVHGAYCLGCCWALFAVLVAAGVMSIAWMLLLTLVVFVEKVLPLGQRLSAGIGVALTILGVLVASGAIWMPWAA